MSVRRGSAAKPAARDTRGRFIVIEGLDGAGTTTQTQELVRRLVGYRLAAFATAEPSRGPIGALLRQILGRRVVGRNGDIEPGVLALLFAADRLDHAHDEILPLLARGRWVVSDRYVLSSLAYQGLELPPAFVAQINARAPQPDLTLFLDLPAEVSLGRRHAEATAPDLFENLATQRRVAKGYQAALIGNQNLGRVVVLDGTGTIGAVADAIERAVCERFKLVRPAAGRQRA